MLFHFGPRFICVFSSLLLSVLVVSSAVGQDGGLSSSEVEMPTFDGSTLVPARLSYDLTKTRDDNTSTYAMMLTISEDSYRDQPAWRVEYGSKGRGQGPVLHLDRSSLYPLAHRMIGGFDITYDGSTVTGTLADGRHTASIDTSLSGPVLDEESLNMEVALAGLSLSEGTSFLVRTFSPLDQAVHVVKCTVTGMKTIEVPAGSFETYVVSTTPVAEETEESGRLYLRSSAPHYLIKSKTTVQTGEGTQTSTRTLTALK